MPGFSLNYLARDELASHGFGRRGALGGAVDNAVSGRKHGKHGKGSSWMRSLAGGFGLRRMLRRCFRSAV